MSKDISLDVVLLRKVFVKVINDCREDEYDKDRRTLGKVLTVIDSALSDPEQRKATKDLINQLWYNNYDLSIREYPPQIRLAFKAFGIDLYEDQLADIAASPTEEFNPYEEIVK